MLHAGAIAHHRTQPTQFSTTPTPRVLELARRYQALAASATTEGARRAFARWLGELEAELRKRAVAS